MIDAAPGIHCEDHQPGVDRNHFQREERERQPDRRGPLSESKAAGAWRPRSACRLGESEFSSVALTFPFVLALMRLFYMNTLQEGAPLLRRYPGARHGGCVTQWPRAERVGVE